MTRFGAAVFPVGVLLVAALVLCHSLIFGLVRRSLPRFFGRFVKPNPNS